MAKAPETWLRFIISGVINTFITYGIYYALKSILNYQLSYAIAYVLGITFSYWLNTVMVFKDTLTWRKFLKYPLVYVAQYSISAILMGLLVEKFNMSTSVAPLVILLITIPLTYILSKLIIVTKKKRLTEIDMEKPK